MATKNKEIGDIVKNCKILLLDIEGTTTSISFVKDKLFPYAEENVEKFLNSKWESDDVKEVVLALRKLSLEDQESSVEGVVSIPGEDATKTDQVAGLVKSVKWLMSTDRKAGPLKQLQGLIWKQGYDSGDIKGHVYEDVSPALEQWRATDEQKVYIYSSGSVQAQKLLFGQSLAGDLLPLIDGHFDTAVGAKQEAQSYTNIVEKIGVKPEEILFLTDIVKEAEAARSAGLHAALVTRAGNAALPADAAASFPVLNSLSELTVSNKRKPEPQEDDPPAKVAKTDVENDVKGSSTEEAKDEKMEVEEEKKAEKKEEIKEEIVIEEISDSNDSAPVVVAEPIVEEEEMAEEKETKTEVKQTENEDAKPDTESADKTNDVDMPVVDEILIDEVSESEKQLEDVEEIIENVEPIVDEPSPTEDMEELQNVGEVLEKECDEILSKVQDVTNLDNIPVKPLLNPIAEETMETENTDSNDIVDRILDTELDLEMKQCADIDLNTVTEISEETKTESNEAKTVNEASPIDTKDVPEVKEAVEKVEESSPAETNANASEMVEKTEVTESPEEKSVEKDEPKADEKETVKEKAPEEKVESAEANGVSDTKEEKAADATTETKPVVDTKPEEPKTETQEPQVNGKATNGDSKVDMNGDVSKDDDVKSRLNGVNGANGDAQIEKGQGDCKVDTETTEIKVKTVTTDEPHTDPKEQPTEA